MECKRTLRYCSIKYICSLMPRYFGWYSEFQIYCKGVLSKLASSIVQIPKDQVSLIEARYICVRYMGQVSDCTPDEIWSYVLAISEMTRIHRSKVIVRKISHARCNFQHQYCPHASTVNRYCRWRTWSLENQSTLTKFHHTGCFTTPG